MSGVGVRDQKWIGSGVIRPGVREVSEGGLEDQSEVSPFLSMGNREHCFRDTITVPTDTATGTNDGMERGLRNHSEKQ